MSIEHRVHLTFSKFVNGYKLFDDEDKILYKYMHVYKNELLSALALSFFTFLISYRQTFISGVYFFSTPRHI